MFLAKVSFGSDGGKDRRSLSDAAEYYLGTLFNNGQICGDYLFGWSNGQAMAYANVARPESFAKRYHSQWGASALDEATKAFGHAPQWTVIQDDVPKRFPSWRRSSSLYLRTHAFDQESPVCCGDSGWPIPAYLLPLSDDTRAHLGSWARSYYHHDNVWLASGALEIAAYRQMADPTSDLSVRGRDLCKEIEKATGKRTFFYLFRYYGRKVGEQTRLCPLCGRKWHQPGDATEKQPFCKFDFRCIRCRLVSHCGDSYEDERHARIGEYRGRAQ
jgi:predicted  nucleic acid-binding Zn ribbon protein